MAQNLTYRQLAEEVLKAATAPLTADEVWHEAQKRGLTSRLKSMGKTPAATLGAYLYTGCDGPNAHFVKFGARPARFFLKAKEGSLTLAQLQADTVSPAESSIPTPAWHERDLHPLVVWFAHREFPDVLCRTIFHEKSTKGTNKENEWVHPDIVGFRLLSTDWHPAVVDLSRRHGVFGAKLYSFELKRQLGFANLRSAFFQAVSNSSWAHEGYVVAAEISADAEFATELRRLSQSFGIGVIRIDVTEPENSEVVLRAAERAEPDWATIDKVAGLNADFADFLIRVRNSVSVNQMYRDGFDAVADDPAVLAAKLAKKK